MRDDYRYEHLLDTSVRCAFRPRPHSARAEAWLSTAPQGVTLSAGLSPSSVRPWPGVNGWTDHADDRAAAERSFELCSRHSATTRPSRAGTSISCVNYPTRRVR